ncbi:MAG TPA: adenylate/guanylate cyclase domain-containing protein [Spirochaetia bacterium]|nr:adenylate/guanylate cyclase domain-containing protein [Spirochaetia bacterium]
MNTKNLTRAVARLAETNEAQFYPGEPFVDWLRNAGEEDLYRINVFSLADQLTVKRAPLLETFIRLVKEGVMNLNWDFHCTECNAVAGSHRHLADATAGDHCPLCKVDFRNTLDRNVEVTFTPSESLYQVGKKFLDEQLKKTVALHTAKLIKLPPLFVSGMDCLHVSLFREMFETETLSLRESLQIKQVCIMFTDIKGSTELYDRFGDTAAYALIRDHFDILFERVERHGGVIVKTIGDAVMASFRRPADGVAAALAIRRGFAEFNSREDIRNEILVKIGLHAGSTIMVNLNNRIDYFGQTVNMAARIQNTAAGDEIIVSQAIRNDAESVELLRTAVTSVVKRIVTLKGIAAPQNVYRLKFSAA